MLFICFFQDSGYSLNFQRQSEEKILEQEDSWFFAPIWQPREEGLSLVFIYSICRVEAVEVGPLLSCLEDDLHITTASVFFFSSL